MLIGFGSNHIGYFIIFFPMCLSVNKSNLGGGRRDSQDRDNFIWFYKI